jgi:DNA adenine methylase
MIQTVQQPVLKWAGSKFGTPIAKRVQQLYQPYRDHLWVEPFVGAGGMLLSINPNFALCGDASAEIIGLHQWIQEGGCLHSHFFEPIDNPDDYYTRRETFNQAQYQYQVSPDVEDKDWFFSMMVWLNKACFNGLWRTNSKGFFNVPVGRKSNGDLMNPSMPTLPKYSPDWMFVHAAFEYLWQYQSANQPEFVYCDPPYFATHSSYCKGGFGWAEHVKLAQWAASMDCPVVLSNSSNERVIDLYADAGLNIELIPVRRSISANGSRQPAVEVLAKNFKEV